MVSPTPNGPPVENGFRLEAWEVHPSLNRIRDASTSVQLEPRHMDVLVELARHADRVVSKQELLDAVWPQEFVAESVLTRAIGELRKALGDDAREPRTIETIPRRGYRLIAAVEVTRVIEPDDMLAANPSWSSDGRWVRFKSGPSWRRIDVETRRVETLATFEQTGSDRLFRLSPDGRSMAFQRAVDGRTNVWMSRADGVDARQVSFEDGFAGFPAWSPDGVMLAFEIGRGVNVRLAVVPVAGGPPQVFEPATDLSWLGGWSPDGRALVFAARQAGVWNVRAMSLVTGDERLLTDHREQRQYVRWPNWSPTGDRVVYERRDSVSDLWWADLTTRRYRD